VIGFFVEGDGCLLRRAPLIQSFTQNAVAPIGFGLDSAPRKQLLQTRHTRTHSRRHVPLVRCLGSTVG
jgi:hypothetical protein